MSVPKPSEHPRPSEQQPQPQTPSGPIPVID